MELANVETLAGRKLPFRETVIIPIGDLQLHLDSEGGTGPCDFDRFKEVIEWGVENDAYYIGMGDFVDFASPSNRAKMQASIAGGDFYDSTQEALDYVGEKHLQMIEEVLEPTKGRWLGMLEGHHFWQFSDGTTSDMRLANFVGTQFLGTAAFVRVQFEAPKQHRAAFFTIWAHHGRAGGKLLSAPINQLEHITKSFDADIYLVGHHHKVVAAKFSRIFPLWGIKNHSLKDADRYLVCTGSFLKGYMAGHQKGGRPQGTYVEKGMMNPVALGVAKIWARPKYDSTTKSKRQSGKMEVILSVET